MKLPLMLCALVLPQFAWAGDLGKDAEDMVRSVEFAQIISSADLCGYSLDPEKLAQFMQTKVAALGEFARFNYYAVTTNYPDELASMSSTVKAAKCAMQEELAKQHGLL